VLGAGRSNTFSYLVGYGRASPTRPQHRLASCTHSSSGGGGEACNVVTGLMSQSANPVQLKGEDANLDPGRITINWYNLVAALAAGGVPFCDQQRSLTVGSHLGRQCHSCCERTCLRVTIPPHNVTSSHSGLSLLVVLSLHG
jgi:hypothetical protein